VDPRLLVTMRDSLGHRGPDGARCALLCSSDPLRALVFDNVADLNGRLTQSDADPPRDVGLAHRRLSIIDLVTGDQPMSNEDGSVWVTFNGEIYNYRELRLTLEGAGHMFRTTSDTEVIVHAYEEYGRTCPARLNGIFAFAVWDGRHRELFLARDHFGVKPLYYANYGDAFRFGSELKAILADPCIPRQIDPSSLNLCLTLRYTPSPWTMLKGIYKLPPASYLAVSQRAQVVDRYWDGQSGPRVASPERDLVHALRYRLDAAVARQMVSDVPISLSLSSGIDSSALLAIMARHSATPVQTFTVGFADRAKENEIALATQTAQQFGARSAAQLVTAEDYVSFLERYMWHLEEPIGNESAPAYYFVARMAQDRGIKVLVNGQGPDEVFAGYARHLGAAYGARLPVLPERLVSAGLVPLAEWLPVSDNHRRLAYSLVGRSEADQLLSMYTFVAPATRARLLNSEIREVTDEQLPRAFVDAQLQAAPPGSRLERMLYVDTRTSLPDNLLLCQDKMAMAAGIEARVPFLDLEFMQLAEQVPGSMHLRWGRGKHLHRQVCAGFLPPDVVRRPKIGFKSTVDLWLRSRLGECLQRAISTPDSLTRQYLNSAAVEHLIAEHSARRRNHQRILFLVLSMEAWHRTFVLLERPSGRSG
jgi:asparagine synthase (glutamine-hydrolysing)